MPYNYKTELQKYRKYYESLEPVFAKTSNKAYTTVIFSFLAISLFGWYAIRPTIQTILYLRREISDKTELNKQMEDKISALIDAQAFYQEIEPLVPAIDQALPPNPDEVPLAIQFRNLANDSGVSIATLQLPATPLIIQNLSANGKTIAKAQTQAPIINFTMIAQGTYGALHSFVEGIQNMRRIASIESMAITKIHPIATSSESATLEDQNILQLALTVRTFYLTQ